MASRSVDKNADDKHLHSAEATEAPVVESSAVPASDLASLLTPPPASNRSTPQPMHARPNTIARVHAVHRTHGNQYFLKTFVQREAARPQPKPDSAAPNLTLLPSPRGENKDTDAAPGDANTSNETETATTNTRSGKSNAPQPVVSPKAQPRNDADPAATGTRYDNNNDQKSAIGTATPKGTQQPTQGHATPTVSGNGDTANSAMSPVARPDVGSRVDLKMPEPPPGMPPTTRADIAGVSERMTTVADDHADLPGTETQAGDARKAVTEPKEETDAKGQNDLIDQTLRQPPSPDIIKLQVKIRETIKSKRPPDENSLGKAKPDEMAKDAGKQIDSSIDNESKKVDQGFKKLDDQPTASPEKQPQALPAQPAAQSPTDIDAKKATPTVPPPETTSLDADKAAIEKKTADAGMETDAAKLVQTGPVAEVRDAKGALSESAKVDPAVIQQRQQATMQQANQDMGVLQSRALAILRDSRKATVDDVSGQQDKMVGSEEQMRARVGQQADQIFDNASQQVDALLKDVTPNATAKWDASVQIASSQFKAKLSKVEAWIKQRHSGDLSGLINELGDTVFGLPDWIVHEYDQAEQQFGDQVCDTLSEISSDVNSVIAACQALINKARKDINALYDKLPADLQNWAAEEKNKFGQKLDGLSAHANQARDTFNQQLTERAGQAVQDAREQIYALRQKAKGLIGQIQGAIDAFMQDPGKFIIDGLLEVVGIPPASFWALVNRIGSVIDQIAKDPMKFANNLVESLKMGFQQFFDHFGTHMLDGLFSWLFGALGKAGVQAPKEFSLEGIFGFFLDVLGISWAKIRKLIVKHIGKDGEKKIGLVEKTWGIVSDLITKGPAGIVELIKEQLNPQTILDTIIKTATDFLIETLIKQVAMRIIGMLNPAGAILQAMEVIYKLLKWIFENAARIFSLVETIVSGVANLLAGNLGGMATAIEGALSKALPVVISFLADLLGLGGLPEKVMQTVKGIQKEVERILDKVIGWLVEKGKGLLGAMGLGGEKEDEDKPQNVPKGADPYQAQKDDVRSLLTIQTIAYTNEGVLKYKDALLAAKVTEQKSPVVERIKIIDDGGNFWVYLIKFKKLDPKDRDEPLEQRMSAGPKADGDEAADVSQSSEFQEQLVAAQKILLDAEVRYAVRQSLSKERAELVARNVKGQFPIFSAIDVVDGGHQWNYVFRSTTISGKQEKAKEGTVRKGKIPDQVPNNYAEQLALEEAQDGAHGEIIMTQLADLPRLEDNYGIGTWVKMQWIHTLSNGQKINIHWFRNVTDGQNVEFKFKMRPIK